MAYSVRQINQSEFPSVLEEIPNPPKKLFCAGELPKKENKLLCVVGSRKNTSYGRDACEKLIQGLSGYPITIISGLALGIDSIAHQSALKSGLQTVAVPGSGLDQKVLYPQSHVRLAEQIIASGGGMISEFEPDFKATPWSFPQRNRIMAGISNAVLVIEAGEKSGTLITAKLALDYNRDVFVVPGDIFSQTSKGSNSFLRLGAEPVTCSEDILKTLGFEIVEKEKIIDLSDLSEDEKRIVEILNEPTERDEIIRILEIPPSRINIALTSLEIKGVVNESMGKIRLN